MEIADNLNFKDNLDIKLKLGDEQIFFSDKILKINTEKRLSLSSLTNQDRNILITNFALYILNGTEIKKRFKIEDLKGITISKESNQMIIHGNQNQYDYLYSYQNRKNIVKCLQNVYRAKTGKDLLFCQKNEKDLVKYVVGKKERLKNPNLFKIKQSELNSIKDYIGENKDIIQEKEPTKKEISKSPNLSNSNKIIEDISIKGQEENTPLTSNKIINNENFSKEELIKQLNEEKNKNNELLAELNDEKKKVFELTNKIKLIKENYSNSNDLKKINELEKEINLKNKELNNLKKQLESNNLVTSISPGEEVIAVNFTFIGSQINYPIACKNTNTLARLEEKIYNEFPQYKDYNTYLTVNGNITKRFKTLEENGIKDGNIIIVNIYDE